jgi:hypothetical protein
MANELKYGDQIHLQNGYNGWQGGYLDSVNNRPAPSKYGVGTAETATRATGTGTWQILSASGKADGSVVVSGDLMYLRNLYGGDGGYLDTCGHATAAQKGGGGKYAVSTSQTKDRATGTGRWRIFAQTSATTDQNIRPGDVVHLWNIYDDNGGFLETNQNSPDGDKYDVCTNAYFNRSSNVADWKIYLA